MTQEGVHQLVVDQGLENEPREIRATVIDTQRMSDWRLARKR